MTDHRTVDVDGIRLAYRVSGAVEAPPLVLLHAMGKTAADWDGVVAAFEPHWRVHALDLRGHGESAWPGDYSLELMRDDVLGFLDALALDRVTLVGHSLGGFVAYLCAEEHPERVERLVLEDVSAPLPRERTVLVKPAGALPFDWEMLLAVKKQIDDPDPVWLDRLGRIASPTLIVAGGSLSFVPQDRIAEMARRIPDARVVTIEAGHLVHDVRPQEFTDAVLSFLRP
ncbi:alpha/beta fold hydrolase [Streptosporangium sp. DT93]|uniref:alpha/beta fold hydrolase n=1 Tax=Streptosporangium sp. DT93 TaxID=3393428 RepID=UPI003CF63C63